MSSAPRSFQTLESLDDRLGNAQTHSVVQRGCPPRVVLALNRILPRGITVRCLHRVEHRPVANVHNGPEHGDHHDLDAGDDDPGDHHDDFCAVA